MLESPKIIVVDGEVFHVTETPEGTNIGLVRHNNYIPYDHRQGIIALDRFELTDELFDIVTDLGPIRQHIINKKIEKEAKDEEIVIEI